MASKRRRAVRVANEAKKPPYRCHVFDSWEDFKHGIRSHLPGSHDYDVYKNYIFRGQGSANWQLRSTFDRI